jgi:hypothetical protein
VFDSLATPIPCPYHSNPLPNSLGGGLFFSNSNSLKTHDLTFKSYSHNFYLGKYSYSFSNNGSDNFDYTDIDYYHRRNLFRLSDFNIINAKRRMFKHSRRMAFLIRKFNIKRVAMLTLTVIYDGLYKSPKEYDNALNRIRIFFNYYKINRITGSEFTQKGVKHYHIVFDSKDIIKICSLPSFKRFVKSYKFTDNDMKVIKSGKRSYLEVYIARFFAKKWRLGFADFEKESKPLYVVKYVNDNYEGQLSLHGRVSYSRAFSRWFSKLTSIAFVLYDNIIERFIPNFQIPIFILQAVNRITKHEFFERLRSEFSRMLYKSYYEKYRYYINRINIPQFYNSAERLGLKEGY